MRFTIPPPLGLGRRIEVLAACPPPGEQFGGLSGAGRTCASFFERSAVLADAVTVASPRWLPWAVSEALAGRVPRTRAFLSPVLSGGGAWDLGRGRHELPMAFAGATCLPHNDGHMCDQPAEARPPEHGRMADGADLEDAGDVLFDDFENMDWPAIRAPGGAA
jgi:hypothetical protein